MQSNGTPDDREFHAHMGADKAPVARRIAPRRLAGLSCDGVARPATHLAHTVQAFHRMVPTLSRRFHANLDETVAPPYVEIIRRHEPPLFAQDHLEKNPQKF